MPSSLVGGRPLTPPAVQQAPGRTFPPALASVTRQDGGPVGSAREGVLSRSGRNAPPQTTRGRPVGPGAVAPCEGTSCLPPVVRPPEERGPVAPDEEVRLETAAVVPAVEVQEYEPRLTAEGAPPVRRDAPVASPVPGPRLAGPVPP